MPVEAIKIDRFEHFTDDERYLLAEALRSHIERKREAFETMRAVPTGATYFLSESDLGIPQATALLDENGF